MTFIRFDKNAGAYRQKYELQFDAQVHTLFAGSTNSHFMICLTATKTGLKDSLPLVQWYRKHKHCKPAVRATRAKSNVTAISHRKNMNIRLDVRACTDFCSVAPGRSPSTLDECRLVARLPWRWVNSTRCARNEDSFTRRCTLATRTDATSFHPMRIVLKSKIVTRARVAN